MKTIKYLISFVLVLFVSCDPDNNDLSFVESAKSPTDISLAFEISQDNSGLVSITPNGMGAVTYNIDLGDGTEEQASVKQGESFEHVYAEGTYSLTVEAIGLTGLRNVVTQDLVVSFKAPENLAIDAQIDSANPFQVNVSATADFAASFEVYFDTSNPDEVATPMQLGETVSFEYPAVGDYTIKVVALSGGAESAEGTTDITINVPVEMPIGFEVFDASKFIGFGGASAEIVDNPDTSGKPAGTVAKTEKNGPEVWAGNVITLSSPIDFSNKKVINLDIWSPRAGGKFLMKLENLDDPGIFIEKEVTLEGNSAWENVDIDFSDVDTSQSYQKIVWFFDIGTVGSGGADWTFYVDNIKQDFAGVPIAQMIQDFEGAAPTFIDFGNNATQVIANPDMSGINTSANVAQVTKPSGAEVWAGSFFEIGSPLDFDNFSQINVKVWSPKSGVVVKLKLENSDASITHEVDVNTTTSNAWENLLYDFSEAPAADYVRIVLFFDFGTAGDDSVYYYDDVELVGVGTIPPLGFQDFEGTAPTFTVFGNIAPIEVIANPDASGINTTGNVAQLTKTAGSEVWAGSFFEVGTPLDLDTFTSISVKTWSPKVGAVVKLKLENSDASITHEVDLNTTTANAWEELVYDFSAAPAADYIRVVIFFDFGVAGDDSAYYYDEFTLTN